MGSISSPYRDFIFRRVNYQGPAPKRMIAVALRAHRLVSANSGITQAEKSSFAYKAGGRFSFLRHGLHI